MRARSTATRRGGSAPAPATPRSAPARPGGAGAADRAGPRSAETRSQSSRTVVCTPVPMLITRPPPRCAARTQASTTSSTNTKSRVWRPSPVIVGAPVDGTATGRPPPRRRRVAGAGRTPTRGEDRELDRIDRRGRSRAGRPSRGRPRRARPAGCSAPSLTGDRLRRAGARTAPSPGTAADHLGDRRGRTARAAPSSIVNAAAQTPIRSPAGGQHGEVVDHDRRAGACRSACRVGGAGIEVVDLQRCRRRRASARLARLPVDSRRRRRPPALRRAGDRRGGSR